MPTSNKNKTSVVIVTHNGLEVLKDCLNGLKNEPILEVIIVDNNSSDGTKSYLRKLARTFPKKIMTVLNKTNNGFAEANNQGFVKAKGEYILFLNNDTLVPKGFLKPLITFLQKKPKVAAVQPLILFPDKTIDSVGSYLTPTGFLYHKAHRQIPSKKNTKAAKVYSLKGACMLWKKKVLDEIGVFDESYFAYFEETDLCHRAINEGHQLWFVPDSKITHLGGFTSNKLDSDFVQFHSYKNRILTYLKNLPLTTLFWLLPIHIALCEGFILLKALSSIKLAWTIQKGLFYGLVKGIKLRLGKGLKTKSVSEVTKNPDLSYYQALFSSLEGYNKLW